MKSTTHSQTSLETQNENQADSYLAKTREGYLSPDIASNYHLHLTSRLTWGKLMMMREASIVNSFLSQFKERISILDCPCGTGILFPAFAPKGGGEARYVIGCDISPAMLNIARRQPSNNPLTQADATRLPFAANSFDIVVIIGFLHRVPTHIRVATLKEAARVSRTWVIGSWSITSPMQRLKRSIVGTLTPKHQFASASVSAATVESEISSAGLRVVERTLAMPLLSSEVIYFTRKGT